MSGLEFKFDNAPDAAGCQIVARGLQDHQELTQSRETKLLNVFAYDEDEIVAGVLGAAVGQRLNIANVWVKDNYRGQNIATELMQRMEEAGREVGCTNALVDTMTFQAPEFYKKQGYVEIARLTNVYDHDRIFLRKEL